MTERKEASITSTSVVTTSSSAGYESKQMQADVGRAAYGPLQPPPIQDVLGTTNASTSNASVSRCTASTSKISTRQYQPDSRTTVTHTTITFPEQNTSGIPIGTTASTPDHKSPEKHDTAPKIAPKMVVPNMSAPVQSPLLLRINPLQSAVVAHLTGTRLCTPIEKVEHLHAKPRETARYRLTPTAEAPILCTFVMEPYVNRVAAVQHIINSPEVHATAFCLPTKQKVKKEVITRRLGCAHLLMPPSGPLQAEKLRPLWETVEYTIALGKNVAVEYRIPKLLTCKVQQVKTQKLKVTQVDSRILYRKVPEERVLCWTAEKAHQIILTTVEKSDPQMIKRVRLEQNPLFERMPDYCNVAEVDMVTTEQIDNRFASSGGGTSASGTERHTYIDHQLVQKWKNTIHLETRRRRIDEYETHANK
ncbi:hypothetical protein Q1695_014547 [Nippostrongylus brasiliensis]|nr:hypothetical protein Q1695_014547 [Nippostrongylus brasiliensis]